MAVVQNTTSCSSYVREHMGDAANTTLNVIDYASAVLLLVPCAATIVMLLAPRSRGSANAINSASTELVPHENTHRDTSLMLVITGLGPQRVHPSTITRVACSFACFL